ncbi:MAG: hypothetical protein OEM32_06295 [Acidimicrobiia bacterium]|nr:hypothetical protein [Acidimicrobiia bacterium]
MNLCIQWCCDPVRDWEPCALEDWAGLPDKGRTTFGEVQTPDNQEGHLARCSLNGIVLGEDHIRLEPIGGGKWRFQGWSLTEQWGPYAKVWEVSDEVVGWKRAWLDADGNQCRSSQWGTYAKLTYYCPQDPGIIRRTSAGEWTCRPYGEFVEPDDADGLTRHGILVSDKDWAKHKMDGYDGWLRPNINPKTDITWKELP